MKKRLRDLCRFLERRNRVSARPSPDFTARHPALDVTARGVTVRLCVAGTPSDCKRDALNTERDLKAKFRARGVKLERRP